MQIKKIFSTGMMSDLIAIISGALLTLSFSPFSLYPLAILSPALLLFLWLPITPKRAFLRGWLFGLGFFTSGVYWIYISIHTFGNTTPTFATLVTGGLIALLASFPGFTGYLLNRYFPNLNSTKVICAFPAIWVALEWIRSWIFTGFPWLFLGYSQINSPLKGFAPILSVYGVSLFVVITSGLLVNTFLYIKRTEYKPAIASLFAILIIWSCGGLLSLITWTKPDNSPIKISMVQGNIPQALKWSPEQILPTLNTYRNLSQSHWDSRIIIWPESAIPMILQDSGNLMDALSNQAKKHHAALITGIPVEATQPRSYYNSVVTVGDGEGIYAKQRLVPFGEYVPFSKMFNKLFALLDIPMSDFISGPGGLKPIQIGSVKIATYICYEIAFPEQVRSRDGDIGMILTVSNDAWFGHSVAQAQHLEMAQMRALEMGRPVLAVSNDGITAFINARGQIQSAAPQYVSYVLTDSIQASTGKTPWQRIGMDPILLTLTGFILIALRCRQSVLKR